ncbi:hypothetical protein BH23PLA1_BH23PLA1_43510 [soil metagenome]
MARKSRKKERSGEAGPPEEPPPEGYSELLEDLVELIRDAQRRGVLKPPGARESPATGRKPRRKETD